MTPSFHFYLRCFLSLLALVIILSSAISIIKKKLSLSYPGKKYWREKREKWRIERRSSAQTVTKSLFLFAGITIGLSVGIPIGYTAHENPQPMRNILILKSRDSHHFRWKAEDRKEYEVTTCSDSPEDWQPGEKIREAFWEQRLGCKSFIGRGLGFQFWTEENGKRTIFPIQEEEEVADER